MRGSLHGFAWFQALELWVSGFGTDGFKALEPMVSNAETNSFKH